MYIRKILIGILMLGILGGCYFMYSISQTIFKPITAFNNEEAYLYIPTGADFKDVKEEILPLLNDMNAFETLAKKLGYTKRVKGGKYVIQKGMNSNDIVKTLLGKSEFVAVTLPSAKEITPIKKIARIISAEIEATETEVYNVIVDTIYPVSKGFKLSELQYIYDSNTYMVPWNTSAEAFRDTIYNRFDKKKANE
ncbi:YceG-like family protein [Kordia sp. SMS9]|uniref:endolytic transglycosylase MltG n=1 Tax=Kordia sp. SMS9 TaxID=2282170 RepID=UPI000E0D539A|nr:endolytic transglycosylase MltG [Kordia sp. SMS9]AXG70911.1 YceG-like family protein [Kordia sp. SMS9]